MLVEMVKPDGLAVVMEADHFCMHWRGVKDNASKMTNSVMRGRVPGERCLRREFLSLIDLKVEEAPVAGASHAASEIDPQRDAVERAATPRCPRTPPYRPAAERRK
jgi:hypothetical protein